MSYHLAAIILTVSVILNCVPLIITLLISWPETFVSRREQVRRRLNFFITAGCMVIHVAAYMLIHKYFWGRWNFLFTIKRIFDLDFTYQDVDYFPLSLAARSAMGFVLGWLIRSVSVKITEKKFTVAPLSKKKTGILLLLFCLLGSVIVGALAYGLTGTKRLRINEVGGYNTGGETDHDYIELYNTGVLDCTVYQIYLSDDSNRLNLYQIPTAVIPAKGVLLVELDSQAFNISKDGGETITLSDGEGRVLDRVTSAALIPNYSYSRATDGGDQWRVYTATPGLSNAEGRGRLEQMPTLSHESGFYDAEFDLDIHVEGDATVYYTLDGSIPTQQSSMYTGPIHVYNRSDEANLWRSQQRVVSNWQEYSPGQTPVDKAFVVRAVAIAPDGATSEVVTATYFVELEQYAGGAVSLVADPEDLWGDYGIYATGKDYDQWYLDGQSGTAPTLNYNQRGKLWERDADFTYFSEDLTFSQGIGLRISGGSSRSRALKSFSLYARTEYSGKDVFDENIFRDTESSRLAIRGGYANSVCQMLVPDRSISTQGNKRVAVFLNGEFWYNANILEKYDDQYFYAHYGVNPGNLVVMKAGALEEGKSGDEKLIRELYDYIAANDLQKDDAYAAFCEKVDIQSYIDYMCFNVYIDNMDFTETKNSVWWRSRVQTANPYEDGKWRFCLYDLDAMEWGDSSMWGVEKQAAKNSFSLTPRYTGEVAINQQKLYVALKQNPQFQKQFVLTFMDMVNSNFRYENALAAISAYGENTQNYLDGNGGTQPSQYYKDFFKERSDYIVPYMAEEFGLTGTLETVWLSQNIPQGGTVHINTIHTDMADGQWSGEYYTDYPVTVKAVASEGYRFAGWEGAVNSSDPELQVTVSEGGITLHAVFEKISASE